MPLTMLAVRPASPHRPRVLRSPPSTRHSQISAPLPSRPFPVVRPQIQIPAAGQILWKAAWEFARCSTAAGVVLGEGRNESWWGGPRSAAVAQVAARHRRHEVASKLQRGVHRRAAGSSVVCGVERPRFLGLNKAGLERANLGLQECAASVDKQDGNESRRLRQVWACGFRISKRLRS